VFAWLRSLFGRRRRHEASPIREADAYARSYGDRSGELLRRAFEARLDARGKTANGKTTSRKSRNPST
jgi:hypothetical protein